MTERSLAVIGVDPGLKGAICLLVPSTKHVEFLATDWPVSAIREQYVAWMNAYNIHRVTVEDVHAIPGAAAGSSFSFGANVDRMVTVPTMLGLSVYRLKPKDWQKMLNISVSSKLKGPLRKRAIKQAVGDTVHSMYPNANIHGPKMGLLDGNADALAIAEASLQTLVT